MSGKVVAIGREIAEAGQSQRYVASLDGIRALCCFAVVGHHFGIPGCRAGWIGVEMFFALSGFLITTLLCREYQETDTLSLTNFWARRAFRLLPIYWLYAIFLSVAVLLRPAGSFHTEGPWTPGLFVASIWLYFINLSPSHLWTHQLWAAHLWSLAKEEQFYFCWPVLLFIFRRRIASTWAVPLILALLGMIVGFAGEWSSVFAYTPLGITSGCTVALLLGTGRQNTAFRWISSTSTRWILSIICIAMLAILQRRTAHLSDDAVRPWASHVIVPLYSFPFALLIANLWYGKSDAIARCLSIKPLTYVGMISYGVYLYHVVLIEPVKQSAAMFESSTGVHLRFVIVSLCYLTVVLAVASISYFFIERPLLRIGKRFRPRVRTNRVVSVARTPPAAIADLAMCDLPGELVGLAD